MIPRILEERIFSSLQKEHKLHLLYGPRQSGKTTLCTRLKSRLENKKTTILYLNCDLEEHRTALNTTSIAQLTPLLSDSTFLFIDEAQRLDNPGLTLKIIHDQFPDIRTLATGSSSFSLKNSVSDALTGRYIDFTLYPFSFREIVPANTNPILQQQEASHILSSVLLYGLYPAVYMEPLPEQKTRALIRIVESYLFKDILMFNNIRYSETLVNLARAIAYQIGSEVNENELSTRLKIDRKTVGRYIDLLEQTFVIVRVHPYAANHRREIGRNYKIYFADLGLRNALIGDFHPLEIRGDIGKLWENFIIIERIKRATNANQHLTYHFWRTYGGAEVDWVEQYLNAPLSAFECTYSAKSGSKGAKNFSKRYKTPVQLITKHNVQKFI